MGPKRRQGALTAKGKPVGTGPAVRDVADTCGIQPARPPPLTLTNCRSERARTE